MLYSLSGRRTPVRVENMIARTKNNIIMKILHFLIKVLHLDPKYMSRSDSVISSYSFLFFLSSSFFLSSIKMTPHGKYNRERTVFKPIMNPKYTVNDFIELIFVNPRAIKAKIVVPLVNSSDFFVLLIVYDILISRFS